MSIAIIAMLLSTDQFIALERWVEAYGARHSSGPGNGPHALHVARQQAFTALTGMDAPISAAQPQDDSDLA
jgi:hypothetical protein